MKIKGPPTAVLKNELLAPDDALDFLVAVFDDDGGLPVDRVVVVPGRDDAGRGSHGANARRQDDGERQQRRADIFHGGFLQWSLLGGQGRDG